MFFYNNIKINNFKFLVNYTPYYQQVNGNFEIILFNITNNNQIMYTYPKGKPLSFTINK